MTPDFCSAVEERFQLAMNAEYPGMKIFFANPPSSDEPGEYAVIHILASEDVLPINVGINAKSRNVGIIQVDAFSAKDIGPGQAQRIAHFAGKIYKRLNMNVTTEGHAVFKDPGVVDRGEVRGKHKQQMRCPYRYDFKDFP